MNLKQAPHIPPTSKTVKLLDPDITKDKDIESIIEICDQLAAEKELEKILTITYETLAIRKDISRPHKSILLQHYIHAAFLFNHFHEALEMLSEHTLNEISLYPLKDQNTLVSYLMFALEYGGYEDIVTEKFNIFQKILGDHFPLSLLYYHKNQAHYRKFILMLLQKQPEEVLSLQNKILYMINILNDYSLEEILYVFLKPNNNEKNIAMRTWLLFQISRLHPLPLPYLYTLTSQAAFPIEKNPFRYNPIPTYTSSYAPLLNMQFEIRISPTSIKSNLQTFLNIVREMKAYGEFDTCITNIENAKKNLSSREEYPVFTLSTGRCGTTALYEILKTEDKYLSYHSYNYQIHARDRNHILYRILLGEFNGEDFKTIIRLFVQARTAELLYAYANNQIPVLTGHWDSVLAPIWSVIFPDSKFIHLERNAVDVFKSFYLKKQWLNNQLQPLKFGFSETGKFHQSPNESITKIEQISWYIYITKVFSHTFLELLPEDNKIYLNADNLFSADIKEYSNLKTFLNLENISIDFMKNFFETPINTKMDKKTHIENIEETLARMHQCLDHLEKTGFLPD